MHPLTDHRDWKIQHLDHQDNSLIQAKDFNQIPDRTYPHMHQSNQQFY